MSARSSTLSMMRSHSATAAIRVAVCNLPDRATARAGSVRLVPRSQAASSRMVATLAASVSACTSTSVTAKPARRWLAAMPAPMMPAPITAGRFRAGGSTAGCPSAGALPAARPLDRSSSPLSRRLRSPSRNTRMSCRDTSDFASLAKAAASIRPASSAVVAAPARMVSRMASGAG